MMLPNIDYNILFFKFKYLFKYLLKSIYLEILEKHAEINIIMDFIFWFHILFFNNYDCEWYHLSQFILNPLLQILNFHYHYFHPRLPILCILPTSLCLNSFLNILFTSLI